MAPASVDVDAVAAKCKDLVIEELLRDARLRREILLAIARETATREDVRMLREELGREIEAVRGELGSEIKAVGDEVRRVEKELRGEISELRARVKALEERMTSMEKRMERLEGGLKRAEKELRGEIARVERGLGERLARVEGQLNLFVKLFIAFNVPVLVGIRGILLKMMWSGP